MDLENGEEVEDEEAAASPEAAATAGAFSSSSSSLHNGNGVAKTSPAAAVAEPPAATAPAPPPLTGSAAVRNALDKLGLVQYAEPFDDLGYDVLPYLERMSEEKRQEVAYEAKLKPGHARKFVELLGQDLSAMENAPVPSSAAPYPVPGSGE